MRTLNFFLLFFLITFSNLSIAEEKTSFWSNVDKFLGQIADGVSKKDNITAVILSFLDTPSAICPKNLSTLLQKDVFSSAIDKFENVIKKNKRKKFKVLIK